MTVNLTDTSPGRLSAWWRRVRLNAESNLQLEALPESEFRRMARDVGLDDTRLPSAAGGHPGPDELMVPRLERLGIDPDFVRLARAAVFQDLERVCATCQQWHQCAHDLAAGNAQVGMETYCLNAATIDALILDDAERAPREDGSATCCTAARKS